MTVDEFTDKERVDWVVKQGWCTMIKKKKPKPLAKDTYVLVIRSREKLDRAIRRKDPNFEAALKKARVGLFRRGARR